MKKRIFSLALAMILVVSMAVPAFAINSHEYSASKGIVEGRYLVAKDGTLWTWGQGTPTKELTGVASIHDVRHCILKNGDYCETGSSGFGTKTVVAKDVVAATVGQYGMSMGYFLVKKDGSLVFKDDSSGKTVKIMDDVVDVDGGGLSHFALKKDGSLWGLGGIGEGILGNGKSATRSEYELKNPIKIMDNVVSFSMGSYTGYAVTKDGTLWAWGCAESWSKDEPFRGGAKEIRKPFEVMKGVKAVTVAASGTKYVIKADNSLWAWNGNTDKEMAQYIFIGNGKKGPTSKPVKIADNVMAVTEWTLIKTDGSVWAWGRNNFGNVKGAVGSGSKAENVLAPELVKGVKYK